MYKNFIFIVILVLFSFMNVSSYTKYEKKDLLKFREEVKQMFDHAYSSYLYHAYPYDELRPLSCDGIDTWGSYSLSLIDALDTLVVMGNFSEFQRVVKIVTTEINFDADINVSVFETNIRILGGLLSAHLFSKRAGLTLEEGWPCTGPLLRLAEDIARRLLPAFDTATGMPYGTVNLRHGVPHAETSITCTAGVGTFILEFGTLSRLTNDPIYEQTALRALHALRKFRSPIGLYGNHLDITNGRWTAQDSGIGAGVDSYLEYLIKGAILLQKPELLEMFSETKPAIDNYLKRDDWYFWVSMMKGHVTMPVFQSLEAYWPGVLSLIGNVPEGLKSIHNYRLVWKHFGFTPEVFNIMQSEISSGREGYPLRPELAESVMYLYRVTKDPSLLDIGVGILRSIQHSAITPCGYATIKDANIHSQEDRMESFFLSELTKYLYLLFDPDNFIHNPQVDESVITLKTGKQCVIGGGEYLFNTEAHPLDSGALECCTNHRTFFTHEEKFTFSNFSTNEESGETSEANLNRSLNNRIIRDSMTLNFNKINNHLHLKGKNSFICNQMNCSGIEDSISLSKIDEDELFNDLIKNESYAVNLYLNNILNVLTLNISEEQETETSLFDLIDLSLNWSYNLEKELSDFKNILCSHAIYNNEKELESEGGCFSSLDSEQILKTENKAEDSADDLVPSFSESSNSQSKKWKSLPTTFQVDDGDVIAPAPSINPLNCFQNSDTKFNLQHLAEKLKKNSSQIFASNLTFDHEVLLCSAQAFESKFMLSGEYFNTLSV